MKFVLLLPEYTVFEYNEHEITNISDGNTWYIPPMENPPMFIRHYIIHPCIYIVFNNRIIMKFDGNLITVYESCSYVDEKENNFKFWIRLFGSNCIDYKHGCGKTGCFNVGHGMTDIYKNVILSDAGTMIVNYQNDDIDMCEYYRRKPINVGINCVVFDNLIKMLTTFDEYQYSDVSVDQLNVQNSYFHDGHLYMLTSNSVYYLYLRKFQMKPKIIRTFEIDTQTFVGNEHHLFIYDNVLNTLDRLYTVKGYEHEEALYMRKQLYLPTVII